MILKLKAWVSRHLHLTPRNVEMLIGLVLLVKGVWLYVDVNYFFYPPNLRVVMNNSLLDIGVMLVGITLFVCALIQDKVKENYFKEVTLLIKIMLVLGGIVMLALALSQMTHGIFTPDYRMGHTALGDLFIFFVIDLTASDV